MIGIPAKRITLQDAKFKLQTIVRNFEFSCRLLSLAFTPNGPSIFEPDDDHQEEPKNFSINDTCAIMKLLLSMTLPAQARFEDSLQETHYIPLPKEGQLRIDDALSEMEAMDYREWNDEPLKSHREFFILGSALYFRKYLLASHLSKPDLLDIEAFLRTNAIYLFIENRPVRDLVIWREIHLRSMNVDHFDENRNSNRSSRWFLTIVARNQLFMAVILESRHMESEGASSSSTSVEYIGPSRFYIEEIQDTLDHLQTGGVENLANTWLSANKRPEVNKITLNALVWLLISFFFKTLLFKEEQISISSSNGTIANTNPTVLNVSAATSSSTSTVEALTMNLKNTEVISILKRRNNSSENVNDNLKFSSTLLATTGGGGSPSINSQTYSDSSLQKYDDDDDESDSDWDGFPVSNRKKLVF